MRKFLRFNSRHHFYWQIKSPEGMGRPQLDPIASSYGPGRRNISWHEPIWLWRLRQRVFAFSGRQRCGRRGENWHGAANTEELPDTWDIGPDGNRTCSYCGSIHFEDLMVIAQKTMTDERYGIEGTDKRYKAYVKQPGVQNASQGAIKFYMAHAPESPTEEQQKLYAEARRVTWERFEARMAERFPRAANN